MKAVKFHLPGPLSQWKDRFEYSQGTVVNDNPVYRSGVYVPKLPWRPLTDAELADLTDLSAIAGADQPHRYCVSLQKIPQNLMDIFREFGFADQPNSHEARAQIQQHRDKIPAFDAALNGYLDTMDGGAKKQMLGVFVLPENQISVAKYKSDNLLMGLHFDDAVGLNLGHLDKKTNRISFNIGYGKRYLWVIDRTIDSVMEEMQDSDAEINDLEDLTRAFLEKNPDYPVLRITIHPGEAYVAPTDCVLHDGSTIGSFEKDVTMVVLGYFNPLIAETV